MLASLVKGIEFGSTLALPLHSTLSELNVRNIWTTNYDTLIEDSCANNYVIYNDSSYYNRKKLPYFDNETKTITKMHGSIQFDEHLHKYIWLEKPVITRDDYETYEERFPLIWSVLRAEYLTRSFLFMGFSFTDPNVQVLLKLARTIDPETIRCPHYAVMKKETDPVHYSQQQFIWNDLEKNGIFVIPIDHYEEVNSVLSEIVRRTRSTNVFLAGSHLNESEKDAVLRLAKELSRRMLVSKNQWGMHSLGSDSSYLFSKGIASEEPLKTCLNNNLKFYYRKTDEDQPVPHPKFRAGTAVYTQLELEELRQKVICSSRIMLIVHGGERTLLEAQIALDHSIPVYLVADGNDFINMSRDKEMSFKFLYHSEEKAVLGDKGDMEKYIRVFSTDQVSEVCLMIEKELSYNAARC